MVIRNKANIPDLRAPLRVKWSLSMAVILVALQMVAAQPLSAMVNEAGESSTSGDKDKEKDKDKDKDKEENAGSGSSTDANKQRRKRPTLSRVQAEKRVAVTPSPEWSFSIADVEAAARRMKDNKEDIDDKKVTDIRVAHGAFRILKEEAKRKFTALRGNSAELGNLAQTARYERYGQALEDINKMRRQQDTLGDRLRDLKSRIPVAGLKSDVVLDFEEVLDKAIADSERGKDELTREAERLLSETARAIFKDVPNIDNMPLVPIGAGGNAEVSRGTPPGTQTESVFKFETRFEYAPGARAAGFPPENIGGALRAQASSFVAGALGQESLLIRARPVLIDGKPAQQMQYLDNYEGINQTEYEQLDGDDASQSLSAYRAREKQISLQEYQALPKSDPHSSADALLDLRSNQANFRVSGNPERIERKVAESINTRLVRPVSLHALNDPVLQEKLNILQFMDLITGQIDRNLGNIMISFRPVGSRRAVRDVKGIDNNMAFGTLGEITDRQDGDKALGTLPRLPKKVDMTFALKVLEKNRNGFVKDVKSDLSSMLTDDQIEALGDRYELVRDHIKTLVDRGDVVSSGRLAEDEAATVQTLNALANRRGKFKKFVDRIESWGAADGWENYFHVHSVRSQGNDNSLSEIPGSNDGSYMARIAALAGGANP